MFRLICCECSNYKRKIQHFGSRCITLVLARMSVWHFRKDKREDGFAELDRILNQSTRHTAGFRGYISLLSKEDPNKATVITLWQDEESIEASEIGVFSSAISKAKEYLEADPQLEHFRVFSTELFQKY